jgi:hypothetical protein
MRRSRSYELIPTPEQFANRFLGEALAAAAAVEHGELSCEQLEEIIGERRYEDVHDDLFAFFHSLEPYRRFGDFQGLETLPRPRPCRFSSSLTSSTVTSGRGFEGRGLIPIRLLLWWA